MGNTLLLQYEMVKQSREVLLQYCDTITTKDFCAENSSFGGGSIRNLLVHTANTYEFWLGKQALQKDLAFTAYKSVESIAATWQLFQSIDLLVAEFISAFAHDYLSELEVRINNIPAKASPLKLFTHVITHEYHHKGQVLSLSRHLGYTPVDTDVMR
ncbi:DinB family protein [Pontibacter sp. H249]|uniref:DinB family protein n=1 Tax=Pontibacter sp. H249 TaxID=3133420 RepID=UPI0030BAF279